MKVIVAIDSLKGSLSSLEAGKAAEEGIKRAMPEADIIIKPVADGRRRNSICADKRSEWQIGKSRSDRTTWSESKGGLWDSSGQNCCNRNGRSRRTATGAGG